jgi:hypothetical protein
MTQEQQHPITPPPELFTEWLSEALLHHDAKSGTIAAMVADKAAQWGYDQHGAVNEAELQKARDEELEACCKVLEYQFMADSIHLRAARRPKPPSLKQQALEVLKSRDLMQPLLDGRRILQPDELDTILRAVEALPND